MSQNSLRILLVDDHVLMRKGIASLLADHPEFLVIGEAKDGLEAAERARELKPDLVLMDIAMPRCNGIDATRTIKREMPHIKILILTVADDDQNLFAAIKEGADGYLLKNLEPNQLFDMLETAQRGEVAISGVMAARILQEFRTTDAKKPDAEPQPDELTDREIEVLELVVEGATNKEIGDALTIAENTVKIHLRNILEKLHLQNRIQAAVYAVRRGLVDDSTAKH